VDDDGVLHVTTTDAHWAREVTRARTLLLKRLEPMLGPGTVRSIKV
jgi:predicted nucleic acid-binding Zn ribbon protein